MAFPNQNLLAQNSFVFIQNLSILRKPTGHVALLVDIWHLIWSTILKEIVNLKLKGINYYSLFQIKTKLCLLIELTR